MEQRQRDYRGDSTCSLPASPISTRRPDVFLDTDTNVCYDPTNLNVRVAPDVYMSRSASTTEAIRPRKIYLPWEVGKVRQIGRWRVASDKHKAGGPGSEHQARHLPAEIGVPEFWRFDPTGGRYYGFVNLNGLQAW